MAKFYRVSDSRVVNLDQVHSIDFIGDTARVDLGANSFHLTGIDAENLRSYLDYPEAPATPPPPSEPAGITAVFAPSLETVLRAGYSPDAAARIVAEEERKFDAGEPPYGNNAPTTPMPPRPGQPDGPADPDHLSPGSAETEA